MMVLKLSFLPNRIFYLNYKLIFYYKMQLCLFELCQYKNLALHISFFVNFNCINPHVIALGKHK